MENFEYKDQKILDIGMEHEVKKSFIEYSMSVIVSRALPDVRDGLKPVHRRILYAMYEDHLTYQNPFRKSATTVGNVLGRYHPHGDSSVYDAMVRLAQPFSMRYPLVEGHGNFGNVDGDGAAAYRYTEARLARLADEMVTDIKKDVVDYIPNFDNKHPEPSVLPARFPNLLVNGSVGIAVGMATNVPPHNLSEVIDGTIMLMDNPDATVGDLMTVIKAPDFPTGAIICGTSGIRESYETGRGRITVRSRAEVDEEKRRIIVTEIPYMVNKATLVLTMADCVKDKKIEGITEIRDESGKEGMRIVVEYRRDANGQVILNQLYKYTQLQDTCAVNMLALVMNESGALEPKVLGLKPILQYYIAHQEEVVTRRVRYDLKAAEDEAHIFEGYKIAIDNIDEVISIIRASASIPDAKAKLIERFALSDPQSQAIVDMTLGKLSGMERAKVEERLAKLELMIAEFRSILADEAKLKQIIKDDMLEIKRKYADKRRTEIVAYDEDIDLEDLIDRHTCVVTMTHAGYIKRLPTASYSAQKRGGKGIIGMATKEEDYVERVIALESHSYLLMFTNTGKVFARKGYQIPEATRTAKGSNIVNILNLTAGEKITAMLSIRDFSEGGYLTMVTRGGMLKRTVLSDYEYQSKNGKIAIALREDDELMFVAHTSGKDEIVIATRGGYSVHCRESDARETGRNSQGVIGIKLAESDSVAGAAILSHENDDIADAKFVSITENGENIDNITENDDSTDNINENEESTENASDGAKNADPRHVLIITEQGYGKRCRFDEFPRHNRGGKGVRCGDPASKGEIAGVATVSEGDDIMIITDDGTLIRTPAEGINVYSRTAGGVIIMRPTEGSKIVNFTVVSREEEEDENEVIAANAARSAQASADAGASEDSDESIDTDVSIDTSAFDSENTATDTDAETVTDDLDYSPADSDGDSQDDDI
ncbi:MAG: DNA gyrase subunit A [Eubacteriales bacterium]